MMIARCSDCLKTLYIQTGRTCSEVYLGHWRPSQIRTLKTSPDEQIEGFYLSKSRKGERGSNDNDMVLSNLRRNGIKITVLGQRSTVWHRQF